MPRTKPAHVRMVESSFYKIIYMKRHELTSIANITSNYVWPETVDVMDSSFDITNPPYHTDSKGLPGSIWGWAEYQFRSQHHAPLDQVHHALRVWWGLYEQICTYLITSNKFKAGNERLAYNVTWTLLGYELNQSDQTLDLAHEIRMNPEFGKVSLNEMFPSKRESHAKTQAKGPSIPTGTNFVETPKPKPKIKPVVFAPNKLKRFSSHRQT